MKFQCPHCNKTLNVKDEFAGSKGRCPGCGNEVIVSNLRPVELGMAPKAPAEPESDSIAAGPRPQAPASQPRACPSCGRPVCPKQRRCGHCRKFVMPTFAVAMCVIPLGLILFFLAGIPIAVVGAIRDDQPTAAVVVPIMNLVVSGLLLLLTRGLWRGGAVAWHVWTFFLGLAVFGVLAGMIVSMTQPPGTWEGLPVVYVIGTVVYAGIMWRAGSHHTWRVGTLAYLAVVALMTALMSIMRLGTPSFGYVLSGGVWAFIVAILVSFTYSVPVRWWYGIRRGWTGPEIG